MDIEIRTATSEEAEIVTWIVFAALDMYGIHSERMLDVCKDRGTLYSWENTRLVIVDGKIAGGLIAYPGELYRSLRKNTWYRCWDDDPQLLSSVGDEAFQGEYYLDSMALFPEFRGMGLGKILLLDALDKAKAAGCKSANLLADKEKGGLIRYYESIGFRIYDSMIYFDHDYHRMKVSFDK